MRVRFLQDRDASPDGVTVVRYERGQVAELPEKLARSMIREGYALSLETGGATPEPDEGEHAEGVTPPTSDPKVQALHSKAGELQRRLKEAKAELEQAAKRRDRLQDEQAAGEIADLLGEDADVPTDEEVQAVRDAVHEARDRVKRLREAEDVLARRLEQRLDDLEEANETAARAAHADYIKHTADVLEGAVEAIKELRGFQDRHKGYMGGLGGGAAPVDAVRTLEHWIKRATDQ